MRRWIWSSSAPKQLRERYSASAIGFYTTGQLFLEEYYTLAIITKAGLGTPHADGNTRLCTATAAAALKETFGADGQTASYFDPPMSQCLRSLVFIAASLKVRPA
jgi:ferredoxin-nitrate reductase